jgi:hypothetical protein
MSCFCILPTASTLDKWRNMDQMKAEENDWIEEKKRLVKLLAEH